MRNERRHVTTADSLHDTHLPAIRRGLVEIPDEATLVGVTRRPSSGFLSLVDENHPALAPPRPVLDGVDRRRHDFEMRGMCAEGAHNAAWEAEGVDGRYRSHVAGDPDARDAVADLVRRLRAGEELVLVCSADGASRRSHRTLLREHVADRL